GQETRPPRPAASPIDFRIDEKLEKHGSRQQDREGTRFSVANHPAGTREKKNQKRRKDEESSGRREEQPGDAPGNGVLELADFDQPIAPPHITGGPKVVRENESDGNCGAGK